MSLCTRRLADQAEILAFCTALAHSSPAVQEDSLNLFSDGGHGGKGITFACLRPLLSCTELLRLDLGMDYPLNHNESEVMEMGAAWRYMESLDLGSDPSFQAIRNQALGTSLMLLPGFAKAFPQLRCLGLYLSGKQPPQIKVDGRMPHRLRRLDLLDVRLSPIPGGLEKLEEVAVLLAGICPQASICAESSDWRDAVILDEEEKLDDQPRQASWEEVDKLMKMISRFEKFAQGNIDRLTKAEVEKLKLTIMEQSVV